MANYDDDWVYTRAAAVLRILYRRNRWHKTRHKRMGIKTFARYFGGRDRRRNAPEHFSRGTRKHLRYIVQQCAKAGYLVPNDRNRDNSYEMANKGVQELDKLAADILKQLEAQKASEEAEASEVVDEEVEMGEDMDDEDDDDDLQD